MRNPSSARSPVPLSFPASGNPTRSMVPNAHSGFDEEHRLLLSESSTPRALSSTGQLRHVARIGRGSGGSWQRFGFQAACLLVGAAALAVLAFTSTISGSIIRMNGGGDSSPDADVSARDVLGNQPNMERSVGMGQDALALSRSEVAPTEKPSTLSAPAPSDSDEVGSPSVSPDSGNPGEANGGEAALPLNAGDGLTTSRPDGGGEVAPPPMADGDAQAPTDDGSTTWLPPVEDDGVTPTTPTNQEEVPTALPAPALGSTTTLPSDAPNLMWRAFGDGHLVPVNEGREVGQLAGAERAAECTAACDADPQCKSFVRCGNTCFFKDQAFTGDEPSRYNQECTAYFKGVDPGHGDPEWVPKMEWVRMAGGWRVPAREGPDLEEVHGSLAKCKRRCDGNPRCASFSRCKDWCWLKDVPYTGREAVRESACDYYFKALNGVPPAEPCHAGELMVPQAAVSAAGSFPACVHPQVGTRMTFYLYRAQSDETYPTNGGLNLGNAAGVMWYLHNEVAGHCPRKLRVSRVLRYRVTMQATTPLAARGRNFHVFLQFDRAQCTNPLCEGVFERYGYVVGCHRTSTSHLPYPSATWFSFPGECPFKDYTDKTHECRIAEPGGACAVPNGTRSCTYSLEPAGEISMEDLTGIRDYNHWCKSHNELWDVGFWAGRHSEADCVARMDKLKALFYQKYPNQPVDLGEPKCDYR